VCTDDATKINGEFIEISQEKILSLKVDELRIKLGKRGVNKAGKKADLQDKLLRAMEKRVPLIDVAYGSTGPATSFNVSARWKLLSPKENEILPPLNIDPNVFIPSNRGIPLTTGVKIQLQREMGKRIF